MCWVPHSAGEGRGEDRAGVVPGLPHHVTQRGNRRQPVFFEAADSRLYRNLVGAASRRAGAEIWAYCLMPNHVHLIVPTAAADRLRATFAEAHRRYTGMINARFSWTGHLFRNADVARQALMLAFRIAGDIFHKLAGYG